MNRERQDGAYGPRVWNGMDKTTGEPVVFEIEADSGQVDPGVGRDRS
jgi:hypothetical protein